MLSERQQRLYKFMNSLRKTAQIYGIAVVVTNQINSTPDSGKVCADHPVGGNIMAHAVTCGVRLQIAKLLFHTADIVISPYHPWARAEFYISEKGIEDRLP
jgi:DNA repair protein RadA